jgi:hypothetical protein
MELPVQITWLFIMALPVACIAWTVTHEQLFLEPREYCKRRSEAGKTIFYRKFFYLFTCEYCFSHYVAAVLLLITKYKLLFMDWRGYLIAGFSLIWVANIYMGLFLLLRTNIKKEGTDVKVKEEELKG